MGGMGMMNPMMMGGMGGLGMGGMGMGGLGYVRPPSDPLPCPVDRRPAPPLTSPGNDGRRSRERRLRSQSVTALHTTADREISLVLLDAKVSTRRVRDLHPSPKPELRLADVWV